MMDEHIRQAVAVMRRGGVIAYPTEAVWGLGCDPNNAMAVQRLLALKQRSEAKGLILVAANIEQFKGLHSDLTDKQYQQLQTDWPGFKTWIVPASKQVPKWITGQYSGVALRVSAHTVVRALCESFAGPIVSTSANVSAQAPASTLDQLQEYFHNQIDYVVPGRLGGALQPSPIFDIVTGRAVRGN